MLEKYVDIAENMLDRAHVLASSGEDIRSTKDRAGLAGFLHVSKLALDDVVRLSQLCENPSTQSENMIFPGFTFPKYDEKIRDNN